MDLSRRSFFAGALCAGGAALAGLAGCAPSSTEASADQGTLAGTGANQEAPTHNPISTEQADVVIVGSGTAGTVAACRAAELGLSVICLEKNSGLGGTSAVAEGFCGIGSKAQAAQNITVDPNAVVADTLAYHHYGCLGPVVRAFADNSGATIDWLEDHGTAWASIAALGDSYQVWHLPADESGMPTHVGDVLSVIQPAAEELGVQFRISTPFTGLRVELSLIHI